MFIFSLVLLCACLPRVGDYIHYKKRHYIFQEKYNIDDTISIGHYQVYTNVWKDNDSLYNHFKDALKKTDFSLHFSELSENSEINNFNENKYLESKKLDDSKIIEYANSCVNCKDLIMVPIIYINYKSGVIASNAGGEKYYLCQVIISIRLIRNNEIVYFKQMRMVEPGDEENYRNYHFPIPQEKWDGLVREVMKEYIERLKWEG